MRTAITLAMIAIASASVAHADSRDQQYLNLVRANGITAGQDDTLIAYAHEFCSGAQFLPSIGPLLAQGVIAQGYTLQVAASRAYCPEKIVNPPILAPVIVGG